MARQNGTATLPAKQSAPAAPAKATARSDFPTMIQASADRLEDVIPAMMRKHLTPDRIIRLSLASFHRKPELQRCEPLSILNAIVQAVQLGFEPDGPLGHAYIIPYSEKVKGSNPERWVTLAQMQVGYKGFADLARRTAGYDLIDSRLVHERDVLSLRYDPSPVFSHVPDLGGDPGKVTHAYAYAYLRGSSRPIFEVMPLAELEKIRASSKSKDSPAWRNWPGEMYKKCVMKRMLKDQPLSVELAEALEYDNEVNAAIDGPPARVAVSRGTAGLKERLALESAGGDEPSFAADEGVKAPLRTEDDSEGIVGEEFVGNPDAE